MALKVEGSNLFTHPTKTKDTPNGVSFVFVAARYMIRTPTFRALREKYRLCADICEKIAHALAQSRVQNLFTGKRFQKTLLSVTFWVTSGLSHSSPHSYTFQPTFSFSVFTSLRSCAIISIPFHHTKNPLPEKRIFVLSIRFIYCLFSYRTSS